MVVTRVQRPKRKQKRKRNGVPSNAVLKRRWNKSFKRQMEREAEENRKRISLKAIREERRKREANKRTDAKILEAIREAVSGRSPSASQIRAGYELLKELGVHPKARREAIEVIKRAENKQFATGPLEG